MKKRSLPEAYWDGYRVRLPHGRGASNWSYRAADKVIVGMWTDHLNFRSRVYDQVTPSQPHKPASKQGTLSGLAARHRSLWRASQRCPDVAEVAR